MHEIKKIAHEAGKYDKYDEKELQKEIEHVEQYINKNYSFLRNSFCIFRTHIFTTTSCLFDYTYHKQQALCHQVT